MLSSLLLSAATLPLLAAASPSTSLSDYSSSLLAGLQSYALSQTTAVIQSLGDNSTFQQTLQTVYSSQNSTQWTLYAPTDAAWAKLSSRPSNAAEVLAYHFVAGPINNYVTANYTVASSAATSSSLPSNGTYPVVVITGEVPLPVIRGSDYNATATVNGAFYSLNIVPIDTVLSQPPALRTALTQDLIPRASDSDSTVNTNFFLDSFGYLDTFGNATGLTVFAPTDEAMSNAASSLARLSNNDKMVVAKNHVFQGEVLYSPILSGSAQLSSSSGGRLSWCRFCGNNTNEQGLSMLVVGSNITANVLRTDVILSNGVLHAIDGVLINTKNNTRSANQAPSSSGRASSTSAAPTSTATFGSSGAVSSYSAAGALATVLCALVATASASFLKF